MNHAHQWHINYCNDEVWCDGAGACDVFAVMHRDEAEHRLNTFDALLSAAKEMVKVYDVMTKDGAHWADDTASALIDAIIQAEWEPAVTR